MCNGGCDPDRCQSCGTGRSIKKTPHKHADLIKAWADGVIIQYFSDANGDWRDIAYPNWNAHCEFRIKPEPKPDIVRYAKAAYTEYHPSSPSSWGDNRDITSTYWSIIQASTDNIKATWDGETGKLKSVEMI